MGYKNTNIRVNLGTHFTESDLMFLGENQSKHLYSNTF